MLGQGKKNTGIEIELDFEHPVLNPVPLFIDMLLRAHRIKFLREKPFVLLVAEEQTLDKVTENINLVASLNYLLKFYFKFLCQGFQVIFNRLQYIKPGVYTLLCNHTFRISGD